MTTTQPENLHIIGLTGSFGSGCTYVAQDVLGKMGYQRVSLSDILRKEYESSEDGKHNGAIREKLQAFGDSLRKEHGGTYLATLGHAEIEQLHPTDGVKRVVVDSIRNPDEIHFLRKKYPSNFFLFGVFASREQRWERVKNNGNSQYNSDWQKFVDDDQRDCGRDSEKCGQRVEDCFIEADVVFSNDVEIARVGNVPFQEFEGKVKSYVELVESPLSRRQPTPRESLMAAAYTISQRSSCMQRKVGALIVDEEGNVISSGFNEVPRQSRPCIQEFGWCGRKVIWQNISKKLQKEFPDLVDKHDAITKFLRGELKMLDNCRSLHAEENAIVNLAKNGRSIPLESCTLYTTTYPCRLCANKIVNLGLGHVIYLEPYPDIEAKKILGGTGDQVKDEFFEGITFKAYARVYGEKK